MRLSTRVHGFLDYIVGALLVGVQVAKALGEAPMLQPDSLMLLEAAFSHFGFSADNGHGKPGFFRNVIDKRVVKGPLVSTFSAQDTVVGGPYAIMSRLAGDNTREIGDASDEFGGIGRNGPLKTTEVATGRLQAAGTAYDYQPGVINNLDGSGGLIKDHADVTEEDLVAWGKEQIPVYMMTHPAIEDRIVYVENWDEDHSVQLKNLALASPAAAQRLCNSRASCSVPSPPWGTRPGRAARWPSSGPTRCGSPAAVPR